VVPSAEYLWYQKVKILRTEPRGVEVPYSIPFCFTFGRVLSFPSKAVVDGIWTVALSSQFTVGTSRCFNNLSCELNISGNTRVVQQGWHNKTTCIHKAFEKVQCLTNLTVYILIHFVYLDQGIQLKHAADLPALFVLDESFHFISFTIWAKGPLPYLLILGYRV
jgi:hypothetical protein